MQNVRYNRIFCTIWSFYRQSAKCSVVNTTALAVSADLEFSARAALGEVFRLGRNVSEGSSSKSKR